MATPQLHKLAFAQEGAIRSQGHPYSPFNREPRSYKEFPNPLLEKKKANEWLYLLEPYAGTLHDLTVLAGSAEVSKHVSDSFRSSCHEGGCLFLHVAVA